MLRGNITLGFPQIFSALLLEKEKENNMQFV